MSRIRRFSTRRFFGMAGIVAAICALGLVPSAALAVRYGAIEVTVEPQIAVEGSPLEPRPGGYIEHRVRVRNYSKTADHKVRLIQPATRNPGFSDYLGRNSRTVPVTHGSTSVVSLFQPALPVMDDNLAVEIDGNRKDDVVELPCPFAKWFGYGFATGARPPLVVLASRGIPQEFKDKVRAAHTNEVAFCRSELTAADWSTNWLGYTEFDLILLTEQEAASLSAELLLTLRRYVEAGGTLLLQGSSEESKATIPDALRDAGSEADADGAFHVGFGLMRPCPETVPWPNDFWTVRSNRTIAPKDRDVQVVSEITVPVRGLLLVVILFAVGIGPVNVWLLTRWQKRMWLWWNVPAVSLATCLAVFAYSLFSEGISGHGRTALITLLDENTHRATTLGFASYYCPLTPSDGLHFSYDTEVAQLHSSEPTGMRITQGRAKTIDWTKDQHLDSGWILSRVPACFAIRKSETRRERLSFRKSADGKVTVVNGLGVAIESLFYRDENGVVAVATDVLGGQERILAVGKSKVAKPPAELKSLRVLFDQPWNASLREIKSFPEEFVAPGCYVAVVKKSPFLEDPLVTASQDGSTGVIYGIGARSGNGR